MTKQKKISPQHSLFVGRWQPFHKGHKTLIETVLKKGKPVVIAIRDTEVSQSNPYSLHERWVAIQESLKEYGSLVKIITIPDIDEICYGREVGYSIRKIDLDSQIENISGTKTREKNPPLKPIIWLTGQSGSGKTTIANILRESIPGSVILDGDEMRESISLGAGFSKKDRNEHNLRIARLALVLAKQSPVIVSVITPFEDTRVVINKLVKPVWVYVRRKLPKRADRPYEVPKNAHVIVDSDSETAKVNANKIMAYFKKEKLL